MFQELDNYFKARDALFDYFGYDGDDWSVCSHPYAQWVFNGTDISWNTQYTVCFIENFEEEYSEEVSIGLGNKPNIYDGKDYVLAVCISSFGDGYTLRIFDKKCELKEIE